MSLRTVLRMTGLCCVAYNCLICLLVDIWDKASAQQTQRQFSVATTAVSEQLWRDWISLPFAFKLDALPVLFWQSWGFSRRASFWSARQTHFACRFIWGRWVCVRVCVWMLRAVSSPHGLTQPTLWQPCWMSQFAAFFLNADLSVWVTFVPVSGPSRWFQERLRSTLSWKAADPFPRGCGCFRWTDWMNKSIQPGTIFVFVNIDHNISSLLNSLFFANYHEV